MYIKTTSGRNYKAKLMHSVEYLVAKRKRKVHKKNPCYFIVHVKLENL